jgi:hypothetical protein
MRQIFLGSFLAVACAGCVAPVMRTTLPEPPTSAQLSELWVEPRDLAERNLFDGPWGKDLAPNPTEAYSFVSAKTVGVSPGSRSPIDMAWSGASSRGPKRRSKSSCPAYSRRPVLPTAGVLLAPVDDQRGALVGRAD